MPVIRYYGLVFREALARSLDFSVSQGLVTTAVLGVLGLAAGIAYFFSSYKVGDARYVGDLKTTAIISGFSPIILLAFGAFVYHVVRAPADLATRAQKDLAALETTHQTATKEHLSRVAKLNLAIEDLERRLAERAPNFMITIEHWAQLMGPNVDTSCNLVFQITVRNSGERSALSDWRLEIPSLASEPLSPRQDSWQEMIFKMIRDARTGGRVLSGLLDRTQYAIDKGDIVQGTLMFLVPDLSKSIMGDIAIRPMITCVDAHGKQHCAQCGQGHECLNYVQAKDPPLFLPSVRRISSEDPSALPRSKAPRSEAQARARGRS